MFSHSSCLAILLTGVFVNQHYGVVQAFQDSDEQFRMPTGVNVTPGPRTINVHWNPPSSKEQLTFCAIEYKKIPDPSPQYPLATILIPVNKDASHYTIKGLRSRTDYFVRLLCFYGSERGPTTEWIRAPAQCDYGMLKCQSGECIWRSGRCDRRYDCPDQSDEKKCNYTCETNQFMCTTELAECISERLVCDGTADCADNSDERDCNKDRCDPNEFQCSNKRCIPNSWVCDGQLDCEQGEDEHWENRNIAGAGNTCDYTAQCKVCPTKFPNGRVQHDCGVDTDCLCSFECDAGFKPHPYFVNSAIGHGFVPRRLLCEDGAYKTGYEDIGLDISGLCIAPGADCQETIPRGRVPYSVWTNTGYLMEMKCDQNYRPRALALEQAHTFTCIDKKWVFKTTMYDSSITADTVCVLNTTANAQNCPRAIPNGHVPDNCMVNCEPVCNHGYHLVGAQQREYRVVTCEDGQWIASMELSPTKDYSVENLCFPDGGMRCSETIPNAEVTSSPSSLTDNGLSINWDLDFMDLPSGSILNRNMRKPIHFKCNEGYRNHRGVPYIECVAGRIRTWQERFGVGLETMCIPDRTK